MVKYELGNKYCSDPPNVTRQILRHPSGRNESIELSVFNYHRFAFYYWVKWTQKLKVIPDLITFDWHQDLGYPNEFTKKELEELDLKDLFEISFFAWARLNTNNDTHILAAAFLNQINDIWVVCKQNMGWEDEYLEDLFGNIHTIKKFKSPEDLKNALFKTQIKNVYLDIDLDYFTKENNATNDRSHFTYHTDKFIREMIDPQNELISWIFKRTEGLTIALEPKCTGGISKSLKILSLIEKKWFNKSIGPMNVCWNHLGEYE